MPFALEHTVTIRDTGDFVGLARANGHEDTTAPWGMEFVVGTRTDGSSGLQAIKADATEWDRARLEAWLAEHAIAGMVEWAGEVSDRMADVPSIRWQEEAGRTFRVLGVPVFRLGRHRGFDYTRAWADEAIAAFNDDEEKGRLPAVILGHTVEGVEKPAVGFMDRLKRVGDTLYADLRGLHAEVFRQVRRGMWPQRSAEVYRTPPRVAALALLGASAPFHKFPALGRFEEQNGDAEWRLWRGMEHFRDDDEEDCEMSERGENVTPERFAEERAKSERLEAEVARLTDERRRMELERFREELRGMGYAPAVVDSPEITGWAAASAERDEPVKFGEEEPVSGLDVPRRVLSMLANQAGKRALFVYEGELAEVDSVRNADEALATGASPANGDDMMRFGEDVDPESIRLMREAEGDAARERIPFREAYLRLRARRKAAELGVHGRG